MGHKILNHHLIFIILIQLFLLISRDIVHGQFIPGTRFGHSADYVGGRIYYIGGANYGKLSVSSDIFYFGGDKDAWVDLSQTAKLPAKVWHASGVGGVNQDSIFIIGGIGTDETNIALVYQFDTKTNTISTPTIQGIAPLARSFMGSVSYGGKIYIFGGMTSALITTNGFNILDTINLRWESGSLVNAPSARSGHTATLVKGVIYIIGGTLNSGLDPMTNIYQYDTITSTWSLKTATLAIGDVPGPRYGHSAVLVEGKICVYGGLGAGQPPKGPIAMLDTTSLVWSVPQFTNPLSTDIPNLFQHTATLVDKYMFVAFGNDTTGYNSQFFIFDFGGFSWVSLTAEDTLKLNAKAPSPPPPSSVPPSTTPKTSSNPSTSTSTTANTNSTTPIASSSESNKKVIVGLSVGLVLVGLASLGAVVFVFYRRRRRSLDIIDGQIPGSEQYTNQSYQPYQPYQPYQQQQQYSPMTTSQSQFMDAQRRSDYLSFNSSLNSGQILPTSSEEHSNHSSRYYAGSEAPPPPPKTP